MQVIGAGVGRTGTHSLKLAINRLGFGPCHHMEAVLQDMDVQVPLWSEAVDGRPDWQRIYRGFNSAVDWPTASFFRQLVDACPGSRFVLTLRELRPDCPRAVNPAARMPRRTRSRPLNHAAIEDVPS
jgi:hypothetical protein